MRRGWVSVLAVAGIVLCAGGRPVAAQSSASGGLTPLDARHFALLKGDRIVIYEVDPSHGYTLRVLNMALLDGEGQVLGQFRPEKPAAVTPAPEPGKAPPQVPPPPASEPAAPAPLSARSSPAVSPFARWSRKEAAGRLSTPRVAGTSGIRFRPQARSPLAARPVQPTMQMAVGPAAPRWSKLCNQETLRTGYLDVASAKGTLSGP
jgi:hypothetical protein